MSSSDFVIENQVLVGYSGETDGATIIIPKGVKTIGAHAFDCDECGYGILTVDLGNEVEDIQDNAFAGQDSLERVMGGGKIKRIGRMAFSGCWKLASFDYPKNAAIGESAFNECSELTGTDGMLIINKEVMAFNYGKYKKATRCAEKEIKIRFPYGVERIGGIFLNNPWWDVHELVIPSTVEYIGKYSFSREEYYDFDLSTVYITFEDNSNLSEIDEGAFMNTRICDQRETFYLPDSLHTIGS